MRIASLLPSGTEMLCALGLEDSLVAVSHSCDYPPAIRRLPRVTRSTVPSGLSSVEIDDFVRANKHQGHPLYEVDAERLAALHPHLIITQGLCDVCAVSESEARAAAIQIPGSPLVLSLSPLLMADIFSDIRNVGRAVGRAAEADRLVASMEARIQGIRGTVDRLPPVRVTLLEWLDPPYACGHWTPELVAWAGGVEGHSRAGARSRRMDWDEIHAWDPEALIIASCGMTSEDARAQLIAIRKHWEGLRCAREGRVFVTDGRGHFSRPGPRLVDSLEWLAGVLHFEKGYRGSPPGHEGAIFQR